MKEKEKKDLEMKKIKKKKEWNLLENKEWKNCE